MPVSQLMVCNWLDQPLKSLARILTVPCLWWVLLFGATKGNVASSYHLATPFSGVREFQQRLSEISVLLWFRKVEKCHHLLLLTRGKVLCGYPEIYNKATEAGSAWMSASDSEWAPLLCGKKKEGSKERQLRFVRGSESKDKDVVGLRAGEAGTNDTARENTTSQHLIHLRKRRRQRDDDDDQKSFFYVERTNPRRPQQPPPNGITKNNYHLRF